MPGFRLRNSAHPLCPDFEQPYEVSAILYALLDALAMLSPITCAGCEAPDRSLCACCRRELADARITPRILDSGLMVFAALRYEGIVQRALLAFKTAGRTDVAPALAVPLRFALQSAFTFARSLSHQPTSVLVLVAVPTSTSAMRRRGYDPVALLCRRAGFPAPRVLAHRQRTLSQKTLGARDRAENLRGAMRARRDLVGLSCVLVDDVLTTGATLEEAARAVRHAGGEVLCAVTLAYTPRLWAHSSLSRSLQ